MVLPDDYADPPPRMWLRWVLGFVAVGVLIGGLVIYVTDAWHPAFSMTPKQREEYALFTVYETLVTFILTNGHWPYDEKDMREHVKYTGGRTVGAYYQWPGDASRLLKLIHVEFNVPLQKVSEADPKKFPYVYARVKGPNGEWERYSSRLMGAANARVQGEKIEQEVLAHPTPKVEQTKPTGEKPGSEKPKEDAKPKAEVKK